MDMDVFKYFKVKLKLKLALLFCSIFETNFYQLFIRSLVL